MVNLAPSRFALIWELGKSRKAPLSFGQVTQPSSECWSAYMKTLISASLLLLILLSTCASGQSGGQAEVATQGYYLSNDSQPLVGTSGLVFKFDEFISHVGLLRGNLEAYRTEGGVKPADNYLELRGLVLGGMRWNLT